MLRMGQQGSRGGRGTRENSLTTQSEYPVYNLTQRYTRDKLQIGYAIRQWSRISQESAKFSAMIHYATM